MTIFIGSIITLLFIIAFIGLVYPIIPSVLFIMAGFIVYGFYAGFGTLPWWFWLIEALFIILLFAADTVSNIIGVKKFGGSKSGLWGSTLGLILGPFIIPIYGILLGPFIGAFIAEFFVARRKLGEAMRSGVGSVLGFLTSVVTKGVIQSVMIILFIVVIWLKKS